MQLVISRNKRKKEEKGIRVTCIFLSLIPQSKKLQSTNLNFKDSFLKPSLITSKDPKQTFFQKVSIRINILKVLELENSFHFRLMSLQLKLCNVQRVSFLKAPSSTNAIVCSGNNVGGSLVSEKKRESRARISFGLTPK